MPPERAVVHGAILEPCDELRWQRANPCKTKDVGFSARLTPGSGLPCSSV